MKDHSILDRKMLWISVKTFFFLEITWFWTEKLSEFASIQLKTNENLGQIRWRLNQTSKKAPPPLRNPGYATDWGDEPRPRFCTGKQIKSRPKKENTFFPKFRWRPKKKGLHQKWNTFFLQIQVDTDAQMHTTVKLLGGCRCRPYSNYWGGMQWNYWGGYIPPPGFRHPWNNQCHYTKLHELCV